jgi:hypothetical protein
MPERHKSAFLRFAAMFMLYQAKCNLGGTPKARV